MSSIKLTSTQRRALLTISKFESVAEVSLEMDGPDWARVVNAERCISALQRRGLVTWLDRGDVELTDLGRRVLSEVK